MTLKNKDGSEYKLQGPNPMMKNQDLWAGFVVHNMEWSEEKIFDKNTKYQEKPQEKKETIIDELQKTKDQEQKAPVQEKTLETESKIEIKENIKPLNQKSEIRKTYIHILPALKKEKVDDLYGDVYNTVQYGEPTSLEGVILKQSDLYFEIWTDVPNITIHSILYPKANIKRWWKIQEILPKSSGWILCCHPSDYQPSFNN